MNVLAGYLLIASGVTADLRVTRGVVRRAGRAWQTTFGARWPGWADGLVAPSVGPTARLARWSPTPPVPPVASSTGGSRRRRQPQANGGLGQPPRDGVVG
jgi:hypothetical protein